MPLSVGIFIRPPCSQPTFRSRELVLTWANWLNCPYINNPNTLAGSRPLPTTPVTLPHSSCLPYLTKTKTKSQIQIQRQRQARSPVTFPPSSRLPYLSFQSTAISNIFVKHSHTQHLQNTFPYFNEKLSWLPRNFWILPGLQPQGLYEDE